MAHTYSLGKVITPKLPCAKCCFAIATTVSLILYAMGLIHLRKVQETLEFFGLLQVCAASADACLSCRDHEITERVSFVVFDVRDDLATLELKRDRTRRVVRQDRHKVGSIVNAFEAYSRSRPDATARSVRGWFAFVRP